MPEYRRLRLRCLTLIVVAIVSPLTLRAWGPRLPPVPGSAAAPAAPAPRLAYSLSFTRPHTHLYELVVTIANVATPELDLSLPTWTPGSYVQREYARHVQDFRATDDAGQLLAWDKIDKATWRIRTGNGDGRPRTVRATYRVYANELFTQTSHLDATHAYFNGASLFMYVPGARDQPHRLRINAPGGWRVTTPLALAPDAEGSYTAPSYDALVDSPTEIGTHKLIEFSVRGVRHRLAIWGEGDYDENRLKEELAKIVEQAASIFGGLPYAHYTFIVHIQPGIFGGTEHMSSNVSQISPDAFKTPREYRGFLNLEAHEYFHCWNVKRIRPLALGPFDYQQENYTHSLWLSEGVTDYYAGQLLRRAGLIAASDYLKDLGQVIAGYRRTPGRLQQSAAAASFDAWIKEYRPDESSPNTAMSYYTKGQILGWLLDFEIRTRTGGRQTLDDVMRMLLERYGPPKPGFTDSQLEDAFGKIAGSELTEFFHRYVYGTEEVDFDRYLDMAGLHAIGEYQPPSDEKNRKPGALGIRTRNVGDRVLIRDVLAGSPAYDGQLNANDEILAMNGRKIDASNVTNRLNELREGQRVTLTIFRRERLLSYELTAALRPFDTYTITPRKEMRDGPRALYEAWLREPPQP